MIHREDIRPLVKAPSEYTEMLRRVGGTNPHGEPMYRIVLAQNRMMHVGGEWWDWKENASVVERGGFDMTRMIEMRERGAKPEEYREFLENEKDKSPVRKVRELRWVPKYPADMKGWIVEKWHPAQNFGSKENWYKATTDGVPDLGPYPEYGDYDEMVAGPIEKLPPLGRIEDAIRLHYKGLIGRNINPAQRTLERAIRAQQAEERQKNETADFINEKVKEINQVLTSSSLAASRVRQELAQRAGITGHVGIVQPDYY